MNIIQIMRKKEKLPFATTWVDLEGIMQAEKDKCYKISLICRIQKSQTYRNRVEWLSSGAWGWER